jgi:ABC-type nitrate/sulfonate/bicarbonate transport system permease component
MRAGAGGGAANGAETGPWRWRVALFRLGFLGLLLLAWWVASVQVERNLIPSPAATWQAALRLIAEGRLQTALWDSLGVFGSGYLLAIAVAIPLGTLMGAWFLLGKTLEVYVYGLAATPRVAFIPLIIVLLGLGFEAKVFIVFLGAVMPILINTYAGVRQADRGPRRDGAVGRRRPAADLRACRAAGCRALRHRRPAARRDDRADQHGGRRALHRGARPRRPARIYGNTFRMAEYFVVVLCLAAIGVIVTEGLRYVEARLGRWRRGT